MDHQTIIQIIITTITIPIALFLFQRVIRNSDEIKKEEELHWRQNVEKMFSRMESKISTYCTENHAQHEVIFDDRNDLMNRVAVIENIHHQRGCDQPYNRRNANDNL